jgi:hypothetical protein
MELFDLIQAEDWADVVGMLKAGAQPSLCGERDGSSLTVAAGLGQMETVRASLDAGAEIAYANDYAFDALGSALWNSHLNVAHYLVEQGAVVSISNAAAFGNLDRPWREWQTLPIIEETIGSICAPATVARLPLSPGCWSRELRWICSRRGTRAAGSATQVCITRRRMGPRCRCWTMPSVYWAKMAGRTVVAEILQQAGSS